MVYITSDHGGFQLKGDLMHFMAENEIEYEDLGAYELVPDDDYTEYVLKMVERVRYNEGAFGVAICRNGVGVSMLANKFKGIRCALSWNPNHAASSRIDDNSNVLALGADYTFSDQAKDILKKWLETKTSEAERHKRRLDKVGFYGQE